MDGIRLLVAMAAGLALYVGFFHTALFLRNRRERKHLSLAAASLTVAIYDVCCYGLYGAETVAEGAVWQRWQFVVLGLLLLIGRRPNA